MEQDHLPLASPSLTIRCIARAAVVAGCWLAAAGAAAQEKLRPVTVAPAPLTVPAVLPEGELTLNGVTLQGNKAVSRAELAPVLARYVGRKIRVAEIYALADEITRAYFDRGYVFARAIVPPQQVRGGVFTIAITEGTVGKVQFLGDGGAMFTGSPFARALEADARADLPFRPDRLSHALLVVGRTGTIDLAAYTPESELLTPADLVFDVTPRPNVFSAGFNLAGSEAAGPAQTSAQTTLNNLTGAGSRTSASYSGSLPELEERFSLGLTHQQPLGADGTSLVLTLGLNRSKPGPGSTPDQKLKDDSETGSLTLSHPLVLTRALTVTASLGVAFQDARERSDMFGEVYADRTYDANAAIAAEIVHSDMAWTTVRLGVSHGIDILDASKAGDPLLSRTGADPFAGAARLDATHQRKLGPDTTIRAIVFAQAGFDSLLSSRECSVSGLAFGHAYHSRAAIGDNCLGTMAEVRHDIAPLIASSAINSMELYGFLEGGWAGNIHAAAASQQENETLYLGGGGLRLHLRNGIDIDFGTGVRLGGTARPNTADDLGLIVKIGFATSF